MEDNHNRRRLKCKMIKMEDDNMEMAKMEDNQNERQPKGRQPK